MWLYYYAAKAAVGKVETCVRSEACSKDVSPPIHSRRWSDALKPKILQVCYKITVVKLDMLRENHTFFQRLSTDLGMFMYCTLNFRPLTAFHPSVLPP